MIVRILKSEHGSTNGLDDIHFLIGRVYDMPDALAEVFLREGWAEPDETGRPPATIANGHVVEPESVEDAAPEFVELSEPIETPVPVDTKDTPSPAMVGSGKRPGRPAKAKG